MLLARLRFADRSSTAKKGRFVLFLGKDDFLRPRRKGPQIRPALALRIAADENLTEELAAFAGEARIHVRAASTFVVIRDVQSSEVHRVYISLDSIYDDLLQRQDSSYIGVLFHRFARREAVAC